MIHAVSALLLLERNGQAQFEFREAMDISPPVTREYLPTSISAEGHRITWYMFLRWWEFRHGNGTAHRPDQHQSWGTRFAWWERVRGVGESGRESASEQWHDSMLSLRAMPKKAPVARYALLAS
jgi:hypothetical protein